MLKYTLCLIKQEKKILLLNRDFPTWMGCWNVLGGKIEAHETVRQSILREIEEEAHIELQNILFKGLITWSTVDGEQFGGLFLYFAELDDSYKYETPLKCDEGILDWKEIDWILHPENLGIAANISRCLNKVIHDENCYNHHSIFSEGILVDQVSTLIDKEFEDDEQLRNDYLLKYISEYSGSKI